MYKKEIVDKWVDEHIKGVSAYKISKKYNCDPWTVVTWLKKRGVYKKAFRTVSDEEKIKIIKLYKQHYSLPEIAKTIGFSHETVRYWVRKANLIRSIKEARKLCEYRNIRPLPLTSKLALFLGIHTGDGSLGGGKNNLTRWQCYLGSKEIRLAQKIQEVIKELFNCLPKIIQKKNHIILHIYNKLITVTLTFYGYPIGKKSRTVKIPKQILCSNSQRIIISFLSGLLATDGYVGITRQGYPIIEFSTSSKFLTIDLSELLKKIKIEPKINISNYSGSYAKGEKFKVRIPLKYAKIFLSKVPIINDNHIRRLGGMKEWNSRK